MLVTMSPLPAVLEEYFFDENPNSPMILCATCFVEFRCSTSAFNMRFTKSVLTYLMRGS